MTAIRVKDDFVDHTEEGRTDILLGPTAALVRVKKELASEDTGEKTNDIIVKPTAALVNVKEELIDTTGYEQTSSILKVTSRLDDVKTEFDEDTGDDIQETDIKAKCCFIHVKENLMITLEETKLIVFWKRQEVWSI